MAKDELGRLIPPPPYVKFKKTHPDAVLPGSKRSTDTGYDITAVEDVLISAKSDAVVPTGVTVADVSPNMWYLVLPRSGLGFKSGIQPHLGVIDQPYRGDLAIKLYNFSNQDYQVKKGDRIAQLAFFPLLKPDASWSDAVTETDRGATGFGNSGR
jgi:dUTP pyrophosphatase